MKAWVSCDTLATYVAVNQLLTSPTDPSSNHALIASPRGDQTDHNSTSRGGKTTLVIKRLLLRQKTQRLESGLDNPSII